MAFRNLSFLGLRRLFNLVVVKSFHFDYWKIRADWCCWQQRGKISSLSLVCLGSKFERKIVVFVIGGLGSNYHSLLRRRLEIVQNLLVVLVCSVGFLESLLETFISKNRRRVFKVKIRKIVDLAQESVRYVTVVSKLRRNFLGLFLAFLGSDDFEDLS